MKKVVTVQGGVRKFITVHPSIYSKFQAACALQGVPQREVINDMMKEYTEKVFGVSFDDLVKDKRRRLKNPSK